MALLYHCLVHWLRIEVNVIMFNSSVWWNALCWCETFCESDRRTVKIQT